MLTNLKKKKAVKKKVTVTKRRKVSSEISQEKNIERMYTTTQENSVKARKDNKLGSSVRSDIAKTVLSTEWNLNTKKAASFCRRILLSIIRVDLDGTLAFRNTARHPYLISEK